MIDARAEGLATVRSGLRLLAWCFAISAALSLGNRLLTELIWTFLNAGRFGMVTAYYLVFQLASLAVAVTIAVGTARLRALPPTERAVTRGTPYRATTAIERDPGPAGLAVALVIATWANAGTDALGLFVEWVRDLVGSSIAGLQEALWLAETAVTTAAAALLVVWLLRASRDRGIALPAPVAGGVLVIVAVRAALWLFQILASPRLPSWSSWLFSLTWIALDLGFVLLVLRLERGLAALPSDEPPMAG